MFHEAVFDGAEAVGEAEMNCRTVCHEAEAFVKRWPICSRRILCPRHDVQNWDLQTEVAVEAR
jgi:hypothetical protein